MSKATDWIEARGVADREITRFAAIMGQAPIWQTEFCRATVEVRDGCCPGLSVAINGGRILDKQEAISFAKWILDTFEEPTQ